MFRPLFPLLILCFTASSVLCQQQKLKPVKGYSHDIGNMVWMMEDLKRRVTNSVQHISQQETDFLLDENANRVGAIILHLAAVEKYYQIESLGGNRQSADEKRIFDIASDLGDKAREELVGQPIDHYLGQWDAVRDETLSLLKKKDDKWFASKVDNMNLNHHWVWYHVMEHQANHMGQIRMILKRSND